MVLNQVSVRLERVNNFVRENDKMTNKDTKTLSLLI